MKYRLLILIASLCTAHTYAHDSSYTHDCSYTDTSSYADRLMMKEPYARATPPNAVTSAVFGTLINHSKTDRYIVAASSPSAGKIELHDMIKDGDVMKMRQVDKLTIPAQGVLPLKPGSFHIMLFDLQHPFIAGEEITLQLTTQDGQSFSFVAPIKTVMSSMQQHH
ncbi:copper chaperone PCu(A)C [Vibrio sp.]|uniref:copper chaperone PCu(A)C n=1 Tax=Vibrio sp. TaxID=678 RepID=UPI003D0A2D70